MDPGDLEAAVDEALQRQADPLIHDTPGSRRERGHELDERQRVHNTPRGSGRHHAGSGTASAGTM